MPTSKDRDFFVNARRVVEQAIGEHMDGTPLEETDAGKDPKAALRVTPAMEAGIITHVWTIEELVGLFGA
jgi:hypothetical protein